MQVLTHTISSDKDTKKSRRISDRRREWQFVAIPFCGLPCCCLSSARVVTFICTKAWWIHSGLWFLTGQSDIPEVALTTCYTEMIKPEPSST